jgi:hypothetical protein
MVSGYSVSGRGTGKGEAMELKLCFAKPEQRPLTVYEINELNLAIRGAEAIIGFMRDYTLDTSDNRAASKCSSVCVVLEWLLEPVSDYLFNFAGEKEAPDNEEPAGAE